MARRTWSCLEAFAHIHTHTHNHTHTHTVEPTRAPHVTLTQFRSVAQSRAGIQNKKTVTFKNRLTFFSSHWWDPHNGSIHLLCQWHLQLIIVWHLQLSTSEIHTLYTGVGCGSDKLVKAQRVQLSKNRAKATICTYFTSKQLKYIVLCFTFTDNNQFPLPYSEMYCISNKSSNLNDQVGHLSLPSDTTHRIVLWLSTPPGLKNNKLTLWWCVNATAKV